MKPSFFATFTPGAIALISTNVEICFLSKSSEVNTVTAWDRSWRLSVLFSAVTIISSITALISWALITSEKEEITNI